MAELALAAVVRKTVDILGNLLVDEAARLYWSKEDIKWVEREMKRMQSFLMDLDSKKSTSHGVANLVKEVRDLAYDVEDIIDTYIPKLASQNKKFLDWISKKVNCLPCGSRHKFVMEIEGIRRRVDDINRSRITYGVNENSTSAGGGEWNPTRQSFSHVDHTEVIGFQEHINALEARLLGSEIQFSVTSIIGMPGVGKTTLAKKVYNSVKDKFHCSAWVYVSREPKSRDLLQDIAKQVKLEKVQREENLEANLFNFLNEKRYVIVIDDIWDVEVWDVLKNVIPNHGENQSRLVLTSRNKSVGLSVGGRSSLHELQLQPLNPEMSWELFSLFIKFPIETDNELMNLGKQILERCGGLPLAIVTIAGLLSTKGITIHAWRGLLNKMGQEKDEICALSYRDLPIVLKPCFLYFGVFPEDRNILVRDLINLWVAEGFIQSQGRQTLEDEGEDYLNELVNRNLIQVERRNYDGRIKSCRIHDVLHDLCISIAREEGFFTTHCGNDSITAMESRRVAIHQQSIYNGNSSNYKFSKLRALLYFKIENERLPDILLYHIQKGFKLLRVLHLEGFEYQKMLPKEIGNLFHLKYLRLRGTNIILPASMGNLRNLQVLDCQECEGLILPIVIWKMNKLRHVFINITTRFERSSNLSHKASQFQTVEVSLPDLQTLYTLNTDFLKADNLLRLTNLKNLGIFGSIKLLADVLTNTIPISEKLEKFHLVDDSPYITNNSRRQHLNYDIPALKFSGYQNLRKVYLEGPLGKLPHFSRSLTKLNLVRTELENDPMKQLGMLPNLRVLELRREAYMGHLMVISGPDIFPSLQVLKIERMTSMKTLKVEDGDGVMPKLQKVKIKFEVTLDIQSERLKGIFQEFNDYLMRQSFLESEVLFNWSEDDFIWEDYDSIMEENGFIEPSTEVTNKGKELTTEELTEGEITETPKRVLEKTFELGECSSHLNY